MKLLCGVMEAASVAQSHNHFIFENHNTEKGGKAPECKHSGAFLFNFYWQEEKAVVNYI